MGMCKECGEVFSALEMTDGYCKNCITNEIKENSKIKEEKFEDENTIGFQWWTIWAWLGLTIGNLYTLGTLKGLTELAIVLIVINTALMIFVLKYNKYAFLIATVLSLNPLLWIINGIYLKNRWNHPKVNPTLNINITRQVTEKKVLAKDNKLNTDIVYCSECGNEIDIDDKFCAKCGHQKD
jgi:ribosomal protein L37E